MLWKQYYPECAQLQVTGQGTEEPGEDFLRTMGEVYRRDGELFLFLGEVG